MFDPGVRSLKKTLRLLRLSVAQKKELVRQVENEFDIGLLCNVIGLARSSFYYTCEVSDDQGLRKAIEGVCLHHCRYGYRRVTPMLHRGQYRVNHKRVLRLMKQMGLLVQPRRRKVLATEGKAHEPPFPNLLKGLKIKRPDQVWCADITYIFLANGSMLYLALVLDIFTRMIRGWALSRSLSGALTQEALFKAFQRGHRPQIHHSDRGSQYTAHSYCQGLWEVGAEISMASKGKAWENPFVESAIGHLKDEEVWQQEYVDLEDALVHLSHFLDVVYNHQRIHSALGYLTPGEFKEQFEAQGCKKLA